MRKVSKKRAKQLREYNKKRKVFLEAHPICQVKGCNAYATEIHHKKGRENDLLLQEEYWMAICHPHHRKVTDEPAWAMENGYSISRLAK